MAEKKKVLRNEGDLILTTGRGECLRFRILSKVSSSSPPTAIITERKIFARHCEVQSDRSLLINSARYLETARKKYKLLGHREANGVENAAGFVKLFKIDRLTIFSIGRGMSFGIRIRDSVISCFRLSTFSSLDDA